MTLHVILLVGQYMNFIRYPSCYVDYCIESVVLAGKNNKPSMIKSTPVKNPRRATRFYTKQAIFSTTIDPGAVAEVILVQQAACVLERITALAVPML